MSVRNKHKGLAKLSREVWPICDRRPPWQWCEDNITSIPYSPVPGRFRSENSPWIREPMEAIADESVSSIFNLASIQSSKTLLAEVALCYIAANLPGPTLWLDKTDPEADDQSENRLQVLFDQSPPVAALLPSGRQRHRRKKSMVRFLNEMQLWVRGANNITNLQRRSIRWLFGDEVWAWPRGHLEEAKARVTAFGWLGKVILMSQGGEEGDDADNEWKNSDQRTWTFSCPHCDRRQEWDFSNLEWSKDARNEITGKWDYDKVVKTTSLRCANEACNHYFPDTDRTRRELNARGGYVVKNPDAPSYRRGYRWNSLCAMSWGKLAELYLKAKDKAKLGDMEDLKIFYQKRMAQSWKEDLEDFQIEVKPGGYLMGEEWEDEGALDKRGQRMDAPYSIDDVSAPLRFITIDVQQDHLYLTCRQWNWGGSSRLLWHEKIPTYETADEIQERFRVHANLVFVDANYHPSEVYRECAKRGWVALIGDKRATFAHKTKAGKKVQRFYSPKRKVSLGKGTWCQVYHWSNLNIKDILYRMIRRQNENDAPFWQLPDDISDEYKTQMDSERRVNKNGKWIWEQIGNRPNHYWDTEAMQITAAVMMKLIGTGSDQLPEDDGRLA